MVEWIIAISTLIGGIYLLSPTLDIYNEVHWTVPLLATVASHAGVLIFAFFFLASAALLIIGIIVNKPKWRATGAFLNGLTRLYVVIAALIANGLVPLSWISNATLMVIAFYIWRRIKTGERE